MLSRNVKILAAAGAGALLTAGGVSAAQLDKAVTLSVDGQATTTHVFGSTVGDLLEKQGITVGADDVVMPAAGSPLSDGDTVSVSYARSLHVTVDGRTRQVSTTERTVDGALAALGLRDQGSRLSVSRSLAIGREGLAMTVVTPKQVSVVVDGKTTRKTITAGTVGEALSQLRVTLGKADKVTPAAASALTDGVTVTIQRVATKDRTGAERISFKTVRTPSSKLYDGETKVSTEGVSGIRTVTTRQTVVDGKVTSTEAVSSKVTKAPVDQVVLVGTKNRPAAATPTPQPSTPEPTRTPSSAPSTPAKRSTGGSGGSINLARAALWDRIAACESGGNWAINTGNGYYGGLQFASATWLGAGGGDFASRADLASRAEQITVANRLYASSGTSPWGCA